MGILGIGCRSLQQRVSTKPQHNNQHSDSESPRGSRGQRNKQQLCRKLSRNIHSNRTWSSIPVLSALSWTRHHESNCNPEGYRGAKRNRYHKYLYPIIGLLIASPVNAENVGGISATANPIANSSGSVDQPGDSGIARSIYH